MEKAFITFRFYLQVLLGSEVITDICMQGIFGDPFSGAESSVHMLHRYVWRQMYDSKLRTVGVTFYI